MINAEEFRCEIPDLNAVKDAVLYCSAGDNNLPEIWSAIGTILASVIALGFGALELHRSRQDRLRQELAEERANSEQQFRTVQSFMRQIGAAFPHVDIKFIFWMQGSVNTYISFLRASATVPESMTALIESNLSRYMRIAHSYAAGVHPDYVMYAEVWADRASPAYAVLNLIDTQFETILAQWHRTGLGADESLRLLKGLEEISGQFEQELERKDNA
ncbi:hypothetical protein NMP99_02975 [Glutamicibacter mishrai]|uniref:hypothetical protein n=1 Tax=Glutamicibacter mishrai TaxID=1775880 RepID=UPI0020CBE780|nr:hypothetical protein [Glutamicibacter mishrai]UTT40238.1 hypothetical protein NMP99_02685 [Glutamicibacter mishrai]UTT40289.1 hypothetical protein NMP99_02975 [Glutamicibacter mishrai]